MSEIRSVIDALKMFRDERDWAQFHNAKDLALALSIEASELCELFLWKAPGDADRDRVAQELADVFNYALLLLDKFDFDFEEIMQRKIEINRKNYPITLAQGNADKHHS